MKTAGLPIRLGWLVGSPLLVWLALPGARFSLWPLLFICLLPLFYWLSKAGSGRQASTRGLISGLILYVLQLYWIIPVLMQYGGLPWFVALPSLLLLAFYMSLYLAVFSGGVFLLLRNGSFLLLAIGVPSLWVGLDWIRSWLFGGFPWMDLGYGFWAVPQFIQAADLFGHYGYTFLIILVNLLIFTFLSDRFTRGQRFSGVLVIMVFILALSGYSLMRWNEVELLVDRAQKPVIGIVQGNVGQDHKWSPTERELTVKNYIRLSEALMAERFPTLIIWPETALPFYPRDNELLLPVSRFVRHHEVTLMTGAPWYEIVDWDKRLINYYNSALLMPPSGKFSDFYYKNQLVPYGEYVPLKRYMPFLAPLVEAVGDFTPGSIDKPLSAGTIRAGVLICYESIFEKMGRAWVESGANVFVNLTNDAWYGKSSAPHQSWAMTVYRTVEARRSLVRSANTGISGVIDPLGRVLEKSELFVEWAGAVAVPLLTEKTFFVRGGFLFAPICAGIALLILLTVTITSKRADRLGSHK